MVLKCSLANIYGPNRNTYEKVIGILAKFEEFKIGKAIIAGDFNLCLDHGKDCSSHVRGRDGAWVGKFKKKLQQLQLVDVWRIQHGDTRDYAFYSPVHMTYSRLDFILIEHRLLEDVMEVAIGNMLFSDHAPVSLQIKIGETHTQGLGWRLNEDLLQDKDILERIKEELEWYFKINVPGEVNEATVWEAHKVYIRGIFMMVGTEKKKEMERRKLSPDKRNSRTRATT